MIRIASIDDDMNLPDAVREKLAANLGDPSTPEGAELSATIGAQTRPRPLPLPAGFGWQDAPIRLLWDGRSVATDFDVRSFKHTGGTTYYVDSANGSDTNTGLNEGAAFQTLGAAFAAASAGDDVVILDEKVLWRSSAQWDTGSPLGKGVNIIARHEGLAMPSADLLTYTKTSGRSNVWQASRSNVVKVIDVEDDVEGRTLTKVTSLAECDATAGSWFLDGATLYVHAFDSGQPDPWAVFALLSLTGLAVKTDTSAAAVFMQGVRMYGGNRNLVLDNRAGGPLDFYAYRCGLFHATGTGPLTDNLVAAGARNVYLQECTAKHSNKDGANYALYDLGSVARNAPQVIEVDCDMGHNGLNQTADLSCNASTGHGGSKIIRVGGTYQDTMGGVVCDVHPGTQSVNAGISVSGSRTGNTDATGALMSVGQGAEAWVFGGRFLGGVNDLYAEAGSTLHGSNPWYYVAGGPGVVDLDLIA